MLACALRGSWVVERGEGLSFGAGRREGLGYQGKLF